MSMLNLSGADTSVPEFEPLAPGSYNAAVLEAKWEETKGGGKLPAGTPMLSIQYKITDERLEGKDRRAFDRYINAPAKIDGKAYEHKAKMDGMLVRFLVAIGYDKDEVMGGKFELDVDDLGGRECVVTLGVEKYTSNDIDEETGENIVKKRNTVKGVKKAGSATGAASGGLI